MKVLITGGAGYIGYSAIKHLVKNDIVNEVVIYDNLSRKNTNLFLGSNFSYPAKVSFIHGDILDGFNLEKAINGVDVLVHLAAVVSTPFADSSAHKFDQVNNWGTSNLVRLVRKEDGINKFIHLSSMSVYGDTAGAIVNESHATSPKSFYGASKLNAERHVMTIKKPTRTYILRSANVFGYNPCVRLESVVNKFLFEAHYKGRIVVEGSGNQKRPFISIERIGKIISDVCTQDSITSGIHNILSYNYSINEVVEKVKKVYTDLEVLFVDQHHSMRSTSASSSYINSDDQTIESHIEYFKNQFTF